MAGRWWSTTLLILLTISGCARQHVCPDETWSGPADNAAGPALLLSQRPAAMPEPLMVDASALNDAHVRGLLSHRLISRTYHALGAEEVRRLAAERSVPALLLLEEQGAVAAAADCDPQAACGMQQDQQSLQLRADEQRNRSAAAALRAFYRLAEAEHGLQAIARSLSILDAAIQDVNRARDEGVPLTVDVSALERQRLELLDQQATTELAILQLNHQLMQLIAAADEPGVRIWPAADLQVAVDALDEATLVSQGLARRADLQLLRNLRGNLSADSVASARRALAVAQLGLGAISPAAMLFGRRQQCACLQCEAPIRERQIDLLLYERERQAESEIRSAVYSVEARQKQIALAAERLASWRERYQQLQALRNIGSATPSDLAQAELEILRAETSLVQQVIAWRLADVDLREALGVLADAF